MAKLDLPKELHDLTASVDPPRSLDRFRRCPTCGQVYDTMNLDAVFYHDERPHEPVLQHDRK